MKTTYIMAMLCIAHTIPQTLFAPPRNTTGNNNKRIIFCMYNSSKNNDKVYLFHNCKIDKDGKLVSTRVDTSNNFSDSLFTYLNNNGYGYDNNTENQAQHSRPYNLKKQNNKKSTTNKTTIQLPSIQSLLSQERFEEYLHQNENNRSQRQLDYYIQQADNSTREKSTIIQQELHNIANAYKNKK